MNYTAFLTRDNFDTACAAASQGQADAIARAFPDVFKAYVDLVPSEEIEMRSASPGPAKAREPKAAPTVDKEALTAQVFAYVRAFPNVRAEEVEATAPDGMDAKAWNRMLRGILEKFVTDGKMYADGERRGRRYKVAVKASATEPEVAAE